MEPPTEHREGSANPVSRIIVGLGNPGDQYARTRHNIGFMAAEALADKASGTWLPGRLSRICRIEIDGYPVILVEPLTYMNRSGEAVRVLLADLDRSPQDLVILVDDLNLPFGRIRVRERGSAGGHRGIESILSSLNTDEFLRIRMGIGEERMPEDKSGFVLSDFPPERQTDLKELVTKAGNAVESLLRNGVSKTMEIFNA